MKDLVKVQTKSRLKITVLKKVLIKDTLTAAITAKGDSIMY